jgi:L-aminopeptidase/D-esterase-like protein
VIDTGTGLPFEPGAGATRLRRPPGSERAALRSALTARTAPPLNTTIGVVATSARLSKAEASKLADIAHDGIARAVRPAHTLFDGDTVFALALGDHELDAAQDVPSPDDERSDAGKAAEGFRRGFGRPQALHQLFAAAVDCFALACTDAVVSATATGHEPAYRDLCPSVLTPRRPTASVSH